MSDLRNVTLERHGMHFLGLNIVFHQGCRRGFGSGAQESLDKHKSQGEAPASLPGFLRGKALEGFANVHKLKKKLQKRLC